MSPQTPIDLLLSKLDGARPTKKNQWLALCPAHDDSSPSLSIGVDKNGTVGLTCFKGCTAEQVCSALRLTLSDLFPGKTRPNKKPSSKRSAQPIPITDAELDAAREAAKKLGPGSFMGSKLTTIYPYRDAVAKIWGWRARYETNSGEKQIKPFHHNGTEWVQAEPEWPRAGKLLYRLPEVLASDGPVFVVEGEKCADALAAIGIAATTSGGATSAGKADWSLLMGRACVVWPDNDDPGGQYAAAVVKKLAAHGCDVSVIDVASLELPGEGDDAADWLAANSTATADDVLALPTLAPPNTPADDLFANLVPISTDVWAAAETPHPHAFQDGHVGIFPVGEVSVIGSPGRTGKTTVLVTTAVRHLLGETLGGLPATATGPVVVLSAEDSPTQFARKLRAATAFTKARDISKVEQGFIVPDFDSELLASLRQLVSIERGQPIVAPEVEMIVDALRRLQEESGIGMVFIETASTWNAANEDNPSFRALIAAAKQIARALNVAVVLTHHVSQSSGNNLSKLDLSVADLRGGTTFVDNSRQVALLVNLGSDDNPFPDDDSRTVLRHLIAPRVAGKVSALVFLNSSQGEDVPPLFFEWVATDYGPACIEITPPQDYRNRKWYAIREMVNAVRPRKADNAKAAKVEDVVAIVTEMHHTRKAGGKPPTARAVSNHANKSDTWATDALKDAVEKGLLICKKEKVPRVQNKVDVYQPIRPHDRPND